MVDKEINLVDLATKRLLSQGIAKGSSEWDSKMFSAMREINEEVRDVVLINDPTKG